ncbi:CD63 antigen-like [Parasteatoda tepidariorum]|uniref:CD63 antigen-like n=1 Tax=Parasteatoda tepidariorum TaxID=114398 RepID=UPI001C71FD92|nr:CD63 antigen-like [Parasteatoda tepidariorum]
MFKTMRKVKFILVLINFIFVVCGIALIAVGVLGTKKHMTEFLDSKFLTAPVICIVVGCVMFVVAFLGCCGAIRHNHFMVIAFAVLVFILMILEVAGGVAAYYYKDEVQDFLKKNMYVSLIQQKEGSVEIWDELQYEFECCGVEGPDDYTKMNFKVPNSCCKDNAECSESNAYTKGCFVQLHDKIKKNITIIIGVAIGIAAIQLLGFLLALCLAHRIKKDNEDR